MPQPWFRNTLSRLRRSRDSRLIYAGECPVTKRPILFEDELLLLQGILEGPPGVGKTSMIMNMTEQVSSLGNWSIVLADGKCHTLELLATAQAGGLPVSYGVDRVGFSTAVLNLFEQRFWSTLPPLHKASLVASTLNVAHKLTNYGPGWYGSASFANVYNVFKKYQRIQSWKGLREALYHVIVHGKRDHDFPSEARQAGLEILLHVDRLSAVQCLNAQNHPHALDLCSLFERPQILYWGLPAMVGFDLGGEQGRALLFGTLAASAFLQDRPCNVLFLVDEAPRISTAANIDTAMQQARSHQIALLQSVQTLQDLSCGEKDLRATVEACTSMHWVFGLANPMEQRRYVETVGTRIEALRSESQGSSGANSTQSQTLMYREVPIITLNMIKAITANPRLSVLTIKQDKENGEFADGLPILLHNEFHLSRDEYAMRKKMHWPAATPQTIVTTMPSTEEEFPPIGADVLPVKDIPAQRRRH
jgi:hypothetical protein